MDLVLASQSPRRSELLRAAGIAFRVRPADVDESLKVGESPEEYVRRLAQEKAMAVHAQADAEWVLGADTAVTIDGEIFGKPADAQNAERMLRKLSGREHCVVTGVCLHGRATFLAYETTRVRFAALSDAEISAYVASGEPMDKAGAYAIQGLASKFVERIEGSYSNVVGLPVALVYRWLASVG